MSLTFFTTYVCRDWDLNTQHSACEANSLTDCATPSVTNLRVMNQFHVYTHGFETFFSSFLYVHRGLPGDGSSLAVWLACSVSSVVFKQHHWTSRLILNCVCILSSFLAELKIWKRFVCCSCCYDFFFIFTTFLESHEQNLAQSIRE